MHASSAPSDAKSCRGLQLKEEPGSLEGGIMEDLFSFGDGGLLLGLTMRVFKPDQAGSEDWDVGTGSLAPPNQQRTSASTFLAWSRLNSEPTFP